MKNTKGLVYVQGRPYNGITARVFEINGYSVVDTLEKSDIVVWTGGEDINPVIYGEKPLSGTFYNNIRDMDDLAAVNKAEEGKKFMVGICRGAQLLNCVPNNGTLWQDVNNHNGGHHSVVDLVTGLSYVTNSVHHQQMKLADGAELVAYTTRATRKESYGCVWHQKDLNPTHPDDYDPEVVYYPETRSLLFQGHPEFGHPETTKYFFELMDRYYDAA